MSVENLPVLGANKEFKEFKEYKDFLRVAKAVELVLRENKGFKEYKKF
jgi:hypothetical protein